MEGFTEQQLEFMSKEDSYSLILLLLSVVEKVPKYAVLSELVYILDHENFVKFIRYYSGKTLQIPTMEQLKKQMRVLLLFKFYEHDKLTWSEALELSGFDKTESRSAQWLLSQLKGVIKRYKIGERNYE